MLHIDKPRLDGKTPEENIAKIDRWISDTTDKLNQFIQKIERENENAGSKDRPY